jgi:hypothetical protein
MVGVRGAGTISLASQAARVNGSFAGYSGFLREVMMPSRLAYVGEMLANAGKEDGKPGDWDDETGNLRRSITWVVLNPGESQTVPYNTKTEGVKNVEVVNDTDGPMLVVFAGMKYGVYVQNKPGYDVLQGPLERNRATIKMVLGAKVSMKGTGAEAGTRQKPIDQL